MDLQDFRIFARVAAVKNLSAVGQEMGLTPGTISKRLQALENDLNACLFERTTRSIRITSEGQTFLAHVEKILADVEMARASVGDYVARPRGELRICAPNQLGRYELAPIVSDFLLQYPEIDVSIELSDHLGRRLHENGFDLALRIGDMADSSLITKRIGSLRQTLTASPAYLAARGEPRTPEELVSHDCLIFGEGAPWSFVDASSPAAASITVPVRGRFRSNGGAILHKAALDGLGILRSSDDWVRADVGRGRLVPVLPDYPVADEIDVYVVYSGTRHVSARLRVMLDFLSERFRKRTTARSRVDGGTLAAAAG